CSSTATMSPSFRLANRAGWLSAAVLPLSLRRSLVASARCYCACATTSTPDSAGDSRSRVDLSRLRIRRVGLDDLPQLRQLQPQAHGGLDDVDQLLRLMPSADADVQGFPRRAYLAETLDSAGVGEAAAFLNVVLVDNCESAVLTHGRARSDLVGSGVLARLAAAALADVSVGEGRLPIRRTLGSLCMPRYSRDALASRSGAFTVLSSLGQLGFHFNSLYYRTELAPRLLAPQSAPSEPIDAAEPGDLWRLLADRPATRQRLFPSGHLQVCRLPMRLDEDNLMRAGSDPVLGPGARPFVSGLNGTDSGGDEEAGISFRCQHRASLGRHLLVTAYTTSEAEAVAHLVAQMRRVAQQPGSLLSCEPGARDADDDSDADDDDVFVSLFFPLELGIPSLLNLIQAHPVLHNLPLSSNPKLNCKLHAVEHAYVGPLSDLTLASPEDAIPDDVTNIDKTQ
ncbi:hypothetical protein BOX15_Mlig026052g1, partial [Macrostomum lignano]